MYHPPTVFLIADDAAVRDALSISLSMDGLKIAVYHSGNAFLDAYEDEPGCLLMDLSLPELDCLAVQQALIQRNLSIPVIFLTDIGTLRDAQLAIKSGVFCLLQKPVSRSLLLKSIHEAVSQDRLNRFTRDGDAEPDKYSSAGS
jgi:two-component system, LuxR family, response regulator FixJ